MTKWIFVFALLSSLPALADLKFGFNNEELSKMIETYSKATGQKFVIDPGVKGKATILIADKISEEEAFNLLSDALALNGYAITRRNDTMVVTNSRNIQRNLIETTTTLPPLKPERMVTYIVTLKNIPAQNINRNLRILPSKDGEMSVLEHNNQIIFTDWTSNLHRIDDLLKKLDVPMDPKLAKIADASKRDADRTKNSDPKKAGAAPKFTPSEEN